MPTPALGWAAVALAGGPCAPGEQVVYACPVDGGKVGSVCREADRLVYRFGTPGGVELTVPAAPRPISERGENRWRPRVI